MVSGLEECEIHASSFLLLKLFSVSVLLSYCPYRVSSFNLLDYDVITDLLSFFICCVLCALRCLVSAFHPKSIFVHIQADSTDSMSLSVNVE